MLEPVAGGDSGAGAATVKPGEAVVTASPNANAPADAEVRRAEQQYRRAIQQSTTTNRSKP